MRLWGWGGRELVTAEQLSVTRHGHRILVGVGDRYVEVDAAEAEALAGWFAESAVLSRRRLVSRRRSRSGRGSRG